MAVPGDSWNGPTLWETIIAGIAMIVSFAGGIWSRGATAGKNEGEIYAKIAAITQRVDGLERRHEASEGRFETMTERLSDKMSAMAERISNTPTRDELSAMFARLEAKLDAR